MLQLLDPEAAAFNRERERRIIAELKDFLQGLHGMFRVGDLEAAAELTHMLARYLPLPHFALVKDCADPL